MVETVQVGRRDRGVARGQPHGGHPEADVAGDPQPDRRALDLRVGLHDLFPTRGGQLRLLVAHGREHLLDRVRADRHER